MRKLFVALWMLFFAATSALAEVSIGINVSLFPAFVRVPGYPVYYAPRLGANFFFYDGFYWVYEDDNWYVSSWYNGPWRLVFPEYVPLFILRIPVRYYVSPPPYFRHWRPDGPPRWGQHWGRDWERQRSGWDRWDRKAAPAPAPLPTYQRKYSGDRYPEAEQQKALHNQNYRYRPREASVRQHIQEPAAQRAPAQVQRERQGAAEERRARQQDERRSRPQDERRSAEPAPFRENAPAPRNERRQRSDDDFKRAAPDFEQPRHRDPVVQDQQPRQQRAAPPERQAPSVRQEYRQPGPGPSPEPRRGQGQEKERDRGQERGPERGQGRDR
ncbi:MAG: hypothetical protein HYU74_04480 [Dechloromonas sp.]|nr:hypothetical protein [Dechloromonas sp.]